MYGQVLGLSTAGAGVLVLPNTGGDSVLTIAAYITIAVGVAVLTTSVVRSIAKKAYKA
ncbi:hypothetical protein H7Y40_01610 [Pedobacter sp.]|nr:hypothetical protein [Candidatus Saccharibacteria bacterium]